LLLSARQAGDMDRLLHGALQQVRRAAGASVLRRFRNSRTIIITNNGAANVGSVGHMLEGIRQNIYWFSSRNGG